MVDFYTPKGVWIIESKNIVWLIEVELFPWVEPIRAGFIFRPSL
jgi:hypothetical protein